MTPPANPPRRPTRPRIQSPTERELASEQARRERASSIDDAVPGEIAPYESEDLTGQYEGEELERLRRERRNTDQRIGHLENKVEMTVAALGDFKQEITGTVAHMSGVMDGLVGEIRRALDTMTERDHVRFTTTVDVDATKQKAAIESQAETEAAKAIAIAKAEAAIEVAKAKAELEKQALIAKAELVRIENRRKMVGKVLAGAGLIAIGIIAHAIAQHFGWIS